MKKAFFILVLLTSFYTNNILAATLSINPSTMIVDAPENIFVDINISGLQSGGSNTLLGGWELDFTYDPNVFSFLAVPPAGFGGGLGDIHLGEAISLAEPVTTPGTFHLGAVSLLEGSLATCIFCDAPYLEDLQNDSFTLATVGLFLPGGSTFTGTTFLNMENIVLSDANGDPLAGTTTLRGEVNVPEPETLLLIALGLPGLRMVSRKKNFQQNLS